MIKFTLIDLQNSFDEVISELVVQESTKTLKLHDIKLQAHIIFEGEGRFSIASKTNDTNLVAEYLWSEDFPKRSQIEIIVKENSNG